MKNHLLIHFFFKVFFLLKGIIRSFIAYSSYFVELHIYVVAIWAVRIKMNNHRDLNAFRAVAIP